MKVPHCLSKKRTDMRAVFESRLFYRALALMWPVFGPSMEDPFTHKLVRMPIIIKKN